MSEDRAARAVRLLTQLADALNECQKAGLRVKLKHDTVYTRDGYVLPIKDKWAARTLVYTEFEPLNDDSDDE